VSCNGHRPTDDLGDVPRRAHGHAAADHLALDPDTAERLVAGELAADDAPPGYSAVARVLAAVAGPAGADELADEGEAKAAYARGVADRAPTASLRRLAVAGIAVLLLASGTAGAATGALPGRLQNAVSDVLERVGISVPDGGASSAPGTAPPLAAERPDSSGLSRVGSCAAFATGQGGDRGVGVLVSVAGEEAVAEPCSNATGATGATAGAAVPPVDEGPPSPTQDSTPAAHDPPPPAEDSTSPAQEDPPPPGHGGTPPGQDGTPPGQGGAPPGQAGTPPGQGNENGNGIGNGASPAVGPAGAVLGAFATAASAAISLPG
jgi:hypothetical protein